MPSVIIPPTDVSPYTGTGDQVLSNSPTIVTPTITGKLQGAASTLTSAGFNLPQGTAPTTPVNGDIWTTSGGLYAQIAGSTVGPFSAGGTTVANPTATIGLSAVNGTATTAMRSDAAPALSQAIVPTWTGLHTFSPTLAANTSGDGVALSNPTAATSGNAQYSPRLKLLARIWSGSASQTAVVTTEVQNSASGANDLLYLTKYAVAGGTEYSLISIAGRTATVEDAAVGVGPQTVQNGWAGVSVGGKASTGEKCVSVGGSATSVNESVAIGYLSNVGSGPSIALGARSTTTGGNQFVAGSGNNPISSVYFGKGVTNGTATAYTIYGTGGTGTNNAGAALQLCGGVSTGNATPGNVVIRGSTAGASGSTAQTVSDIATFNTSGVTVATALSDSIGNVRSIPQNAQTAAYILAATDNGKHISITTGGVTVNSGIFSAGQVVVIFNNSSSAQTITQGTSVTMYQGGTTNTGNRTLAAYGVATVLCVASNTFVITGSGLT